jgi:hypothetical protein
MNFLECGEVSEVVTKRIETKATDFAIGSRDMLKRSHHRLLGKAQSKVLNNSPFWKNSAIGKALPDRIAMVISCPFTVAGNASTPVTVTTAMRASRSTRWFGDAVLGRGEGVCRRRRRQSVLLSKNAGQERNLPDRFRQMEQ